jgi:hypothetical protein
MIVSGRPDLTDKNIVSGCQHDKAHQRRDLVSVSAMSFVDCDCFFCCVVISEREPDKSDGDYRMLWPKTTQNGSKTRHHDQCASPVSLRTANTMQRSPAQQNPAGSNEPVTQAASL